MFGRALGSSKQQALYVGVGWLLGCPGFLSHRFSSWRFGSIYVWCRITEYFSREVQYGNIFYVWSV